jgi:hypothetical protein
MKCHDFQELISAYVDGELSQTQRDFVEEHLQHCCGCQLTLAEYTRISNQMSSLRSTPPLPDIKEEIMSKTTPENVINKPRRWLRPVLIAAPFVLALAIVLPIVIPNLALTPEKVLAKASTAILKVQSYRDMDKAYQYNPATQDMSIQTYQEEDEFANGSFHFNKEMLTSEPSYSHEQIGTGGQVYIRGDSSVITTAKEWQENTPSAKLTQEQLDMLTKIEVLPEESIDGVDCYHYRGTVDIEKYIQKMQAIFSEEGLNINNDMISQAFNAKKITDEFWIGKDDYIIRQYKELITDTTGNIDLGSSMEIVKYYDFNAPISIESPLDTQGNLLPGWSLVAPDSFSPTDK